MDVPSEARRNAYSRWLAWASSAAAAAMLVPALIAVPAPPPSIVVLFIAASIAAEYLSIPLPQSGYQTFGPLVALPAVLVLGPGYAALAAALGMALGNGLARHRPAVTVVFNAAQRTLSVLLAGLAWNLLQIGTVTFAQPDLAREPEGILPAMLAMLFVYIASTHIQVSVFSAARRGLPVWEVFTGNALIRTTTTAVLGTSSVVVTLLIQAPLRTGVLRYALIPAVTAELVLLLYASRRQLNRQLVDVHDAVTDLLQILDRNVLLQRLAEKTQEICTPDVVWVAVPEGEGAWRVAVARGAGASAVEGAASDLTRQAAEWMAELPAPRRILDYPRDPRFREPMDGAASPVLKRIRSVLIVPLLVGRRPVGVLAATQAIPDYFTEHQERAVAMLAAQAALVLNNVTLYEESQRNLARVQALTAENMALLEEARRKAHQLALLNRAVTRVAGSSSPDELFERIVEEVHVTLEYPLVTIRLRDGDQLRLVAHRGEYAALAVALPLARGIVGRVARTGNAALVTNVRDDPDYLPSDDRVMQEACAPIVIDGQVAGVLNVETIDAALAPADLDLLVTLAGYAAVALQKARLHEQTQDLATTDGLTGLLNYRAFWQALGQEMQRSMRYGLPLALIMIEIDKFKQYNDTYGHLRGDEVIRLVARTLVDGRRVEIDLVARYGGDEFMILLPNTTKAAAADVAERIRTAVETLPLASGAGMPSVTLSLGVAGYPDDGKSPDALVDAVDRSMYRVKEGGGNAVALAKTS